MSSLEGVPLHYSDFLFLQRDFLQFVFTRMVFDYNSHWGIKQTTAIKHINVHVCSFCWIVFVDTVSGLLSGCFSTLHGKRWHIIITIETIGICIVVCLLAVLCFIFVCVVNAFCACLHILSHVFPNCSAFCRLCFLYPQIGVEFIFFFTS